MTPLSTPIPDDTSENHSEDTLSRCNSAERIGLPDGMVEDRFRVDRRKLEAMILGTPSEPYSHEIMKLPITSEGTILSAEDFFGNIMRKTGAEIKYPKFLKAGARNKKDPHVRIVGTPECVEEASGLVRQELEPHNKITMKLDVAWTHHSHIIGKGGTTIKQITNRTGVSIHFPDGNKNSDVRKSNQVSINSRHEELLGLEAARKDIRQLTPLIFHFSLPATAKFLTLDLNLGDLQRNVQRTYNVQVDLSYTNEKVPLLACSVRGSEWDAQKVKDATLFLLQAFCANLAYMMPVYMKIEISPQHQSFIFGRNNETLKKIMTQTSTTITVPEIDTTVNGTLTKSSITIRGGIENVYVASQKIVGCLPLVLMFDLVPDIDIDQSDVPQIMRSLNVQIIDKNKRQDGRTPVIIKAAERNAENIYHAWKMITMSGKDIPDVFIPPSYQMLESSGMDRGNLNMMLNGYPNSPLPSPSAASPSFNMQSPSAISPFNTTPALTPSRYYSEASQDKVFFGNDALVRPDKVFFNNNHILDDLNSFRYQEPTTSIVDALTNIGTRPQSSSDDSYSPSIEPSILPRSPSKSPKTNIDHSYSLTSPNASIEKTFEEMHLSNDRRAPGCERKRLEMANKNLASDLSYTDKRTLAAKAMKEPLRDSVRVPTANWSGYGFSKSVPSYMLRQQIAEAQQQAKNLETLEKWDAWPNRESSELNSAASSNSSLSSNSNKAFGEFQLFNTATMTTDLTASNYMDSMLRTSSSKGENLSPIPEDLYTLLVNNKLEQYHDLFEEQGVDLETFMTLTESDFKELGIAMFGHRKRLMMAVQSLKCKFSTLSSDNCSSLFSSGSGDSGNSSWRASPTPL